MKTNYKIIFLLMGILLLLSHCKRKDDPCLLSVEIEVLERFPSNSASLLAKVSDGAEPYTYKWRTVSGTVIGSDSFNIVTPGEKVFVEVGDNLGCIATASYTNPCPCQNGGTCAGGTCQCPTGFTGALCELPCRGCTVCGADSMTDTEGNVYDIVSIGTQCWMADNLRVSAGIPEVTDGSQWANLTTPAWCYYDNNSSNGATYGKLYNWHAVNTGNLCPSGWHIPTHDEWQELIDALGGDAAAGGAMKDTTGWTSPNTGATNSSGFTAFPGGGRSFSGNFFGVGDDASFLSSTEYSVDPDRAWGRELAANNSEVHSITVNKATYGLSCRCVKD